MTIPGLSLFYAGLVRKMNILSVLMHCFALTAVMTILWLICGCSLAFSTAGMTEGVVNQRSFIGNFDLMFIEWMKYGKPSMLGNATGSIAGLAAITPASGTVGPMGALIIGAVSGIVCWWASTQLKKKLGYDDSLDVFGVHGVGGFIGTILLVVFMAPAFGGVGGTDYSISSQFGVQLFAALATAIYTGIVSLVILKVVDATVGLRLDESKETQGLDLTYHGEEAYND